MKTRHRMYRGSRHRSGGVGLITAIFLLVVLAGLGVAMVSIFTNQQASSAMDVRGARAYQAARAGVEWGLFQQLQLDACNASATFTPPATTLNMFSVTVQCVRTPKPVAGTLTIGSSNVGNSATDALFNGMLVSGVGIVPGTHIGSITNSTTLVLTNPATVAGVQQLTYRSALDRWQIISTACTEPTAAGTCPNLAPTSPDYMQRVLQVQF